MRTDFGYVVVRDSPEFGQIIEVCVGRDDAGVGVDPHAVYTGGGAAVLRDASMFVDTGELRYSTAPQAVFTPDDSTDVHVQPYSLDPGGEGEVRMLC